MATGQVTQQHQMTSQRKKSYSEPKLRRLDPEDALARLSAAARAGNASAQTMLDQIRRGKADLDPLDPK